MLRYLLFITLIFAPVLSKLTGGGGGSRSGSYSGGGTRSHSYPHSTGYSGYGSGQKTHSYGTNRVTGSHTYPASGGLSGTHSNYGGTKTNVHHHYHYNPPQQITYASSHGPVHYPVYHGQPPVYVYEYRNSGSRFDTLLTGLALYNLGTMAMHSHGRDYHRDYRPSANEVCKLGVRKENGDYEESRISCKLITAFIWEEETQRNSVTNVVTTTTNVTTINSTPKNGTDGTSVVTVTTNKTVSALEEKGPSMKVTPGMQCYLIRNSPVSNMRKTVPCAVLQKYSEKSLLNNAVSLLPCSYVILFTIILIKLS